MALSIEQTLIANAVSGYAPLTDADGAEPYPVQEAFHSSRIRPATDRDEAPRVGWPMVYWRGGWWSAPSMEEVEEWVFDSVCFTPDEEEVEPDHPHSWLSLLGLI